MKKIGIFVLLTLIGLLLVSCSDDQGNMKKVGMITESETDDDPWAKKGLEGLQQIEKQYGVDVFFEENIQSEQEVKKTVEEMIHRGVNLIFGHDDSYGKYFTELTKTYPDVHFVYFDGAYTNKRVSSIAIQPHAMSFFAGMIAARMSDSGEVGVIAAHEWQREIEGFLEGVKYQDQDVEVHIKYTEDLSDSGGLESIYENLFKEDVDVFYPAGNDLSEDIIQRAAEDDVYAIGYLDDQSKIDPSTVLTSTIKDIERVYLSIADEWNKNKLDGGVIQYDFADDVVKLGDFNEDIPKRFQQKIENAVQRYTESGLLPYEE